MLSADQMHGCVKLILICDPKLDPISLDDMHGTCPSKIHSVCVFKIVIVFCHRDGAIYAFWFTCSLIKNISVKTTAFCAVLSLLFSKGSDLNKKKERTQLYYDLKYESITFSDILIFVIA